MLFHSNQRSTMGVFWISFTYFAWSARVLHGQAAGGDTRPTCSIVASALAGGKAAIRDTAIIGGAYRCPPKDIAPGLVLGFGRLRSEQEVIVLATFFGPMSNVADAGLFEAALEVGGDRGATLPARVFAFAYLLKLTDPATRPNYRDLTAGVDGMGNPRSECSTSRAAGASLAVARPLSPNWISQRRALARRVFEDRSERAELRSAAFCAY
jgi:hypothetical protein